MWCVLTSVTVPMKKHFTFHFQLSLTDKKLDMASCIESLAKTSVVYQVPNINRCFLSESKKPGEDGIWRLKTEGVNIHVSTENCTMNGIVLACTIVGFHEHFLAPTEIKTTNYRGWKF